MLMLTAGMHVPLRDSRLAVSLRTGTLLAAIGGPKRLSTQVRGIAEGFFVPLYFVVLGAQLGLHGVLGDPTMLALAGVLVGCNVPIHLAAAGVARWQMPPR
jgi:Kef-type K+ transport system membrane component KefB